MVVNVIANVLSNTFFLVNKPFKVLSEFSIKYVRFFTSDNCDILYLKVRSDFSIKYVRFVRSDNCDILYLKVRSDFSILFQKISCHRIFGYKLSDLSELNLTRSNLKSYMTICHQKSESNMTLCKLLSDSILTLRTRVKGKGASDSPNICIRPQ
jgi:hypothetical protein